MLGFIVEIIGEEAAAKLIARFGGTRLYVPHSPCADDPLARAVGPGAAMKLARMFGGERVELPKPPPRRARILELRAAGRSVEEIARTLNCTRRRVFQVLAEARRADCSATESIRQAARCACAARRIGTVRRSGRSTSGRTRRVS